LCVGLTLSRAARAEGGNAEQARAAYDAGAAAYDGGEFGTASLQFARADELAPNDVVLRLALAAAVRAEDPVLSMNLVQRAERRATVDPALMELMRVTRARFESQVGFIEVRCLRHATCTAYLADQRLQPGLPVAVLPGKAELRFTDGASESRIFIEVVPQRTVEVLEPAAAPAAPAEPSAPAKRVAPPASKALGTATASPSLALPRGVFWGGLVLSGALAAVTVASGIDAANARERFLANRNEGTREHGQAAVERTNVLLGVTLGTAVLTGTVGLFFTSFRDSSAGTGSASVQPLAVSF
jgi:hypothetical protein